MLMLALYTLDKQRIFGLLCTQERHIMPELGVPEMPSFIPTF